MASNKVKVIAGDFIKEDIHVFDRGKFVMQHKKRLLIFSYWSKEKISPSSIQSIETANEENTKSVGGSLGWGTAGAVAGGPIGAIAGLMLGGRKKQVTFICHLKDGRKFMATVNSKLFTKIQAAVFEA